VRKRAEFPDVAAKKQVKSDVAAKKTGKIRRCGKKTGKTGHKHPPQHHNVPITTLTH
jgi:hypothetical protein